jgi:zinc transport system permease protein
LLVSALMVVPVAAAQLVTRGFRSTMYTAMALGVVAAGAGLSFAASYDTAPGATIVLVAIAIFAAIATGTAVSRAVRRRGRGAALTGARPIAADEAEPPDVVLQP